MIAKIAKFNTLTNARNFKNRAKCRAIILGDDNKYWIVNLATMEKLIRQGYETVK